MAASYSAIKIRLYLLLHLLRGPGQGPERGRVCVYRGFERCMNVYVNPFDFNERSTLKGTHKGLHSFPYFCFVFFQPSFTRPIGMTNIAKKTRIELRACVQRKSTRLTLRVCHKRYYTIQLRRPFEVLPAPQGQWR